MTDWVRNYACFTGTPKAVAHMRNAIAHQIQPEHVLGSQPYPDRTKPVPANLVGMRGLCFDFDELMPTPDIFNYLTVPTRPIPDEQWSHGLFTTVDEAVAFLKQHTVSHADAAATHAGDDDYTPARITQHTIPQHLYDLLKVEYGATDATVWRDRNWGTKWIGEDVAVHLDHPNALMLEFDTAWSAPDPLYSKLDAAIDELCISSGTNFYDADGVTVTYGDDTAFYAWWKTTRWVQLDTFDAKGPDGRMHTYRNTLHDVLIEPNVDTMGDMLRDGHFIAGEEHYVIAGTGDIDTLD